MRDFSAPLLVKILAERNSWEEFAENFNLTLSCRESRPVAAATPCNFHRVLISDRARTHTIRLVLQFHRFFLRETLEIRARSSSRQCSAGRREKRPGSPSGLVNSIDPRSKWIQLGPWNFFPVTHKESLPDPRSRAAAADRAFARSPRSRSRFSDREISRRAARNS